MIVTEEQAENAFEFLRKTDTPHAQAKADLKAIEDHENALIAILKKKHSSSEKTDAGQKREAYADPEYAIWEAGHKEAIFVYQRIENERSRAYTALDIWRTESANSRRGP